MSDADKVFAGSVPEFYDNYMVPLIFETFAADLAERVRRLDPDTVLEIAAGSGVVTRALAPLLRQDARYVVTDLNQPMLDLAAARQGGDDRILWKQADALALPFEDSAFDVVCCQFGVMFYPDKVAGFREARRVLRPVGRLLFNVWDRIEQNDFADVVTQAAAEIIPDDPPRFLARTPHGYGDVLLIESDLREAGFAAVESLTIQAESVAANPRVPAVAYCQGTPLRAEIEARGGRDLVARVIGHAAAAIEARFGPGPVRGRIQGHVFLASLR